MLPRLHVNVYGPWTMVYGLLFLLTSCSTSNQFPTQTSILVFSATKGFRHASITDGKFALLKLGRENQWQVDTTEDAAMFTPGNLARYKAIVFLSVTGDILNEEQQLGFQQFIRNGGGFVGIHGAADAEYEWPWYNDLIGAYFESHPNVQEATYRVIDKRHPTTRLLPDSVRRTEEIYNFKSFKKERVKVVMTVDEQSYSGGKMGSFHPAAWYHKFDGGRSYYISWGHRPESFKEPLFLRQIEEGIRYVMGR